MEIKEGNGRWTVGENYYNIDTQEQVAVYMCGFDSFKKGNYFGGKEIRRTEVKVRLRKLRMERLQVRKRSWE